MKHQNNESICPSDVSDSSAGENETRLHSGETRLCEGGVLCASYWRRAANQLRSPKMLVFAALIIALRIVVKAFKIPLAAGLSLSFDCYVNSLGSMVYGPVVGLLVGAVSDTVGAMLFPSPSGPYFFPFIFVEMSSSFLFALFFWQRRLTVPRVLAAKFTVNLFCNIILTSLFYKWSIYVFSGAEAAEAYNVINLVRIAKNLVLFPLEAMLIYYVLSAFVPALLRLRILPPGQERLRLRGRDIAVMIGLTLLSVGLVLFYIFFLKDFLSAHNIKLF